MNCSTTRVLGRFSPARSEAFITPLSVNAALDVRRRLDSVSRAPRNPVPVPTRPTQPSVTRPAVLAAACLVVLLQAAVLIGLGGAWARDLLGGVSEIPGATLFLIAFAVGIAALLIASARALWRGRRWARSPVITWQILLIAMSIGWLGVERTGWAVAVLVSALLVAIGLLLPSVVAATSGRAPMPDGGSPVR